MSVLITGNTYPVKDQLRELGGRWDAGQKGWRVPDERADEARGLVAAAPVKSRATATARRPLRSGYCPQCGLKPDAGWGAPAYLCGGPCHGK